MPVVVNTNVNSIFAQRSLGKSQNNVAKSLQRLTTGRRINSAADDAAGLAISTKFTSQIRGLEQAQRNANDGISMLQTAEGAMEQMSDVMVRMKELAVQSSNGTLSNSERSFLNTEFKALSGELDRIADSTKFNGRGLLNGSASSGITFQVGINNTAADKITVSISDIGTDKLGGGAKLSAASVSTAAKSQTALGTIDTAISELANVRSKLGASQNRLNVTIDNIGSTIENMSASNSRIRDVDVAKESASLTKNQILVQAGVSILAQANQSPQVALSLIG